MTARAVRRADGTVGIPAIAGGVGANHLDVDARASGSDTGVRGASKSLPLPESKGKIMSGAVRDDPSAAVKRRSPARDTLYYAAASPVRAKAPKSNSNDMGFPLGTPG